MLLGRSQHIGQRLQYTFEAGRIAEDRACKTRKQSIKTYRIVGNHMPAVSKPSSNGPVETPRRNNMSRLKAVDPSTAIGKAKEFLDAVTGKLGSVPNMTKVMANSPVVLESHLGFSGALSGGLLDVKTREKLALLTAQEKRLRLLLVRTFG